MKRWLNNYLLHRSGVFPCCPEYCSASFRAAAGNLCTLKIVLFCHVLIRHQKTLVKYLELECFSQQEFLYLACCLYNNLKATVYTSNYDLSQLLDKYKKQTSTLISEKLVTLITETCAFLNYRFEISSILIKTILASRRIKSEFFSKDFMDNCLPKNVHPV